MMSLESFKFAMSYGWWVPEIHQSAIDVTIWIFLYSIEALKMGHTNPLEIY